MKVACLLICSKVRRFNTVSKLHIYTGLRQLLFGGSSGSGHICME